jgi:tetratricopeptide (TPR) repeat protein
MESVYDLYRRGCELLGHGDHQAAIVPLSKARDLEPEVASIREALGRALFHAQRYESAAAEFDAVASRTPTNDYAQFCLGRSMQLLGRHREACKPLALACSLAPERADYKLYRDRARRDAARGSAGYV